MLKTWQAGCALAVLTMTFGCTSTDPTTLTTIATDELITREAVKAAFAPIAISRQDSLTEGTFDQVRDHNNIYWCMFPETAPDAWTPDLAELICEGRAS